MTKGIRIVTALFFAVVAILIVVALITPAPAKGAGSVYHPSPVETVRQSGPIATRTYKPSPIETVIKSGTIKPVAKKPSIKARVFKVVRK